MDTRQLGASDLRVSSLCLGHSMAAQDFGPQAQADFNRLIARALDLGLNFLDSSDAYWGGLHESWLGRALGRRRSEAVLTSKFGNLTLPDGSKATNGRPDYAIACCEASLQRLGTDVIDLYYLHRVDPKVPIEDTIGAMGRLVQQGKVRHIGICEAGIETMERAHRTHRLSALQTEYSLWCRQPQQAIIDTCRRLGIAFVGYSPLGRGLLTGAIRRYEDLAPGDRRRIHPRFKGENLERNLQLVEQMQAMAQTLGLSAAQLALAWVLAQGQDVFALTGTRELHKLQDSVAGAGVQLDAAQCAQLEAIFSPQDCAGERYPTEMLKDLGI
jgi:aryl-alcohol dehydrogenase-like predicted oxidoreductase